MEATVIDFIFSTLMSLSAQYPDAAWLAVAVSVLMTVCGLCAVATVWMPVPKEPTGLMPSSTAGPMPLPHTSGRTRAPWLTASPKP